MDFRTDLVCEASEINPDISGIKQTKINKFGIDGVFIQVENIEASKKINKPIGSYVSFETNALISRDTEEYDCGCRNIIIRNIRLEKKRSTAIAISLNYDTYARSYYPGCVCVPHDGITMENIVVENEVDNLFSSDYPTGNITLKNIDFRKSKLRFSCISAAENIVYPEVQIKTENVVFYDDTIQSDPGHSIKIL